MIGRRATRFGSARTVTLLVPRRLAVLWTVATAVVAIVPAAAGYALAIASTAASQRLEPAAAKLLAERILFIGIVAAAALVVSATIAIARAVVLNRALARLEEMNRISGKAAAAALGRLGSVGDSIRTLYGRLNELSARKTARIGAMNALIGSLIASVDRAMVVTDDSGSIVYATPAALTLLETSDEQAIGSPLDRFVSDLDFGETRSSTPADREPFMVDNAAHPLFVVPVASDGETVDYRLVTIGPDASHVLDL